MDKIIPLISSSTTGPLGIVHLPRLWLKTLLGATGQLADGYKDCGPGYDHMVLEGIGIKPEDARKYIFDHKPTYLQFEAWVKEYPGVKLDKASIFKTNMAILGYIHPDDVRRAILNSCGVEDNGSVNPGAVDLNSLDDWQTLHSAVTSK